MSETRKAYMLEKRGSYYRPHEKGYTVNVRDAALYTKERAIYLKADMKEVK